MPWKETCVMDERLQFLGEYVRRERSMSALCREFGISRKTGYKLVHRYLLEGSGCLEDRSRAPRHHPNAISEDIVRAIVALRQRHPNWGPRKLLDWLHQNRPRTVWPSASSVGRILVRHGKILPRRRSRRTPPHDGPFQSSTYPNAVFCADFKGWFRTGDGKRCDPLTITDAASRFVLACQIVPQTTFTCVQPVFETLFREYGLPRAIRTDNGVPFATTALGGLSRLAVWWIKLGIIPERIAPGCPQQNGRHERFHRTLKEAVLCPPQPSRHDQQAAFDRFSQEYNFERPHEALGGKTPASIYYPSSRLYPTHLAEITYPQHMIVRTVRPCGSIWWHKRELYISEVLIGEHIGIEPIDDRFYQIYYGPVKIARLDGHNHKIIRKTAKRTKRPCLDS